MNEHLVLKFEGRLAALCVKDFVAPDGSEFKKGMWYAPHGDAARNFYKDAYHKGLTKITRHEEDEWALVREIAPTSTPTYDEEKGEFVSLSPEDLMEMSERYAKELKESVLSPEEAKERWERTYNEDY